MNFKNLIRKIKPSKEMVMQKAKSKIKNRARYNVVSSPDDLMREAPTIEHGGEDKILSQYDRLRMLNMSR